MQEADVVEVIVEVPAGGRVKRGADGRLDLVSPLPCPFNYGSVPGRQAADGDLLDAVVLGPPLPRGARGRWRVWAVVRFLDAGHVDDKLICAPHPPTDAELARVDRFFRRYARVKALWNRVRRRGGPTTFLGREAR